MKRLVSLQPRRRWETVEVQGTREIAVLELDMNGHIVEKKKVVPTTIKKKGDELPPHLRAA
jgi:hypothetical protein